MDGNYENGKDTYIYKTVENLKQISVKQYYQLSDQTIQKLLQLKDPFDNDAYRVSVFNSAYSRMTNFVHLTERPNRVSATNPSQDHLFFSGDRKETWNDVCVRVIEGLFSFYVDYLVKNILPIPDNLDQLAEDAILSMARMEWLPPGRGLFAMGTQHTFKNGNAALNNCYAVSTKEGGLVKSASWAMDMLMCGGGVGFSVDWRGEVLPPNKLDFMPFVIPDTRQGWVCALEILLRSYVPINGKRGKFPIFDYSKLRSYGVPIKGFGGTASGPEPLRVLLNRVEIFLDAHLDWKNHKKPHMVFSRMISRLHDTGSYQSADYNHKTLLNEVALMADNQNKQYNHVRLLMDIFNSIGACVVAGNVRRSAQIALGDPDDLSFLDMKDWMKCPERRPWMHLSNNTIRLWKHEDFETVIPLVSERIKNNGEPGVANMINIQRYGRFGNTEYGVDGATLFNPCAEIPLKPFGPCCLATIIPYNCMEYVDSVPKYINQQKFETACKWSTFYATVVTTVPHHWPETNRIINQDRRIGVSYTGIADVREALGPTLLNKSYREGYKLIRKFNSDLTDEMGISKSIRVTTVKPEGTLSIIAGTSAGVHYPICRFGWRRVAFDNSSPVLKALLDANYPHEESTLSSNQTYIIFPIKSNSSKTTRDASIFEKFSMAISAQKHFADNSVSFTGDFKPSTEGDLVEEVLADFISQTKVISMLPQFEGSTDQYKHLPFQEVSEEVYNETVQKISPVDWDSVFGVSREDADKSSTAYCTGGICSIPLKKSANEKEPESSISSCPIENGDDVEEQDNTLYCEGGVCTFTPKPRVEQESDDDGNWSPFN